MDIVMRQPRVIHEYRLRRHAVAEFAQDQLHRDARAPDDGFTAHNIWFISMRSPR
jgi:hypothetical protein